MKLFVFCRQILFSSLKILTFWKNKLFLSYAFYFFMLIKIFNFGLVINFIPNYCSKPYILN